MDPTHDGGDARGQESKEAASKRLLKARPGEVENAQATHEGQARQQLSPHQR